MLWEHDDPPVTMDGEPMSFSGPSGKAVGLIGANIKHRLVVLTLDREGVFMDTYEARKLGNELVWWANNLEGDNQ